VLAAGVDDVGAGLAVVGAVDAGVVEEVSPQPPRTRLLRIITEIIIKYNFFIAGSSLLSNININY